MATFGIKGINFETPYISPLTQLMTLINSLC
jgi:hypothetical protein